MISFNTPLLMIGAFLLLTLVVGVYFSRQKTTFREYAVGNKQFGTATLVATVLATLYGGGGLVRTVEQVHNNGLWWIVIFLISGCFGPWVIRPLALRMGPFMQHLSMAETIGGVYGRYPRVVIALSNFCVSIISLVTQITVTSKAISMCIDSVNPKIITVLATLILVSYSTLGGIRAVTFTDVIQFLTFSIIIPLLAWYVFRNEHISFHEMIPFLQTHPKFQFSRVFHFDTKLLAMIALLLSGLASYIQPHVMQRVYMSSSPIQAKKVFLYSGIFGLFVRASILIIGLFVFVGAPELSVKEVWSHVMDRIPFFFKGFVAISLLAMSMSTSDSRLNVCAVMVSHDILESVRGTQEITSSYRLQVAKVTSLIVGLLAMVVAFYCTDLLKLMYWTLDVSIPITIAPFVLVIFGFRGTSRTALIGMATGALAILAWNKWVKPKTGIDGAFVSMLANGLAMMAAHYLLKQPKGVGWVQPQQDDLLRQMAQEASRKRAECKAKIKNYWVNKRRTLAMLQPTHTTLRCIGFYLLISNLLTYFVASITDHVIWLIPQLLVAACFLGYGTFVLEKAGPIPGWIIGLFWLVGLAFSLPINLIWHWWHGTDLLLTLGLSLAHLSVTLLLLPLYLGVIFLLATLSTTIYLSSAYCAKPLFLSPLAVAFLLLLCLGLGLLIFRIFVYFKAKNSQYLDQVAYLKGKDQATTSRQLKSSLYDSAMVAVPGQEPQGNGAILAQVVAKMEESVSFLDSNIPLYKQDFQSIINKFYDWVAYFSRREKVKGHALLQPTKISVDKLIRKVEYALSQEIADPPKLFLEQIKSPSGLPSTHIVCDMHQVVYLLAKVIVRMSAKLKSACTPLITLQLHHTVLRFKQADPIDDGYPSFIDFPATAWVISPSVVAAEALPKVKEVYDDLINSIGPQGKEEAPPSIDVEWDTVSSIVAAHYGYLSVSVKDGEQSMLLVLPSDVTEIRDKMTAKLPIDCLASETSVTHKEQADSLMALMAFHDQVAKYVCEENPIDMKTVSGLLVLLRKHFRFKRHGSGQLFYVRAVGIAEIVLEWVFHSPKVVYASLLYELVRHTCLPLSYIKAHYNLGVYAFVSNVVAIDQHQALDHPSLLYVKNRLKQAIKADHVQFSVLFIKFAERLYDLRQAAGYSHLSEVTHMVEETRTVDIQIANTYLGPEVGTALEAAAKEALEICKVKAKKQNKE